MGCLNLWFGWFFFHGRAPPPFKGTNAKGHPKNGDPKGQKKTKKNPPPPPPPAFSFKLVA
eukprot:COSAG06_NODE_55572_length_289_cov_0.526316_1_plen_59_part_10